MNNTAEIQFEEISGRDGHLGLITLTRQKALNALSHSMLIALNQQLIEWENANHIKAVIIRAAEGRAFCAGGDIRAMYERKKAGDAQLADYFRDEYKVNKHIRFYIKPYISLLDGITMGGGAGISIHGSHRIGTERLLFAMPETGIGFYPDVGMTYVLSRLPYKLGFYLGLTGARITLEDCIALGLVDYHVKAEQFPELMYRLADTEFEDDGIRTVTEIISEFTASVHQSSLWQRRHLIEKCFNYDTIEEIFRALRKDADDWCHEVAMEMDSKSPTSLKVTLAALQNALNLNFEDAIETESYLTERFTQQHDFFEGVRALLIDKDQVPQWQPLRLAEVADSMVKSYFPD